MNLRVDLIDDTERRSASVFNLKSLIRIGSFVIPAIILLVVVVMAVNIVRVKSELTMLESQWDAYRPMKQQAQNIRQELLGSKAIASELDGWRNAVIPWHDQLIGLMRSCPPNIHIKQLRLSHRLQVLDDKVPARYYTMDLTGRAVGELAEQSVQLLRRRIQESHAFTGRVDTVVVSQFGADVADNARKTDRIFEIQTVYYPRTFE